MAPKLSHICCNHTLPVAIEGTPQSDGSQLPRCESWYSNGFACKSANKGKVEIKLLSVKGNRKVEVEIFRNRRKISNVAISNEFFNHYLILRI